MELHFLKLKIFKLFGCSVLITALGYHLISHNTAFTITIGTANLLIGIPAIAAGIWALFSVKPIIVINEKGIYDRRALKIPLSWEQIETAEVHNFQNEKTLILKLKKQINSSEYTILRRILGQTGKNNQVTLNISKTNFNDENLKFYISEKLENN